jgi:hypothetical protein
MDSITQGISDIVKNAMEEYSLRIVEKFDIDGAELEKIWNDVSKTIKISLSLSVTKSVVEDGVGCPYVLIKGSRTGYKCNGKPKKGETHCTRHIKLEGVQPKHKASVPSCDKDIGRVNQTNVNLVPKQTKKCLETHPVLKRLWHQPTGFIFKDEDNVVVIGKCFNNQIIHITDVDRETCKQFRFSYIGKTDSSVKQISTKVTEKNHKSPAIQDAKDVQAVLEMLQGDSDDSDSDEYEYEEEMGVM